MHTMYKALGVAAVLLVCSCGGDSNPAGPTPHPAVGVWVGTFLDRRAGPGTFQLDLQLEGFTVRGTWTGRPAGGATLGGTVFGSTFVPDDPFHLLLTCAGVRGGTMSVRIEATRMQGEFFFSDTCLPLELATVDLVRQ
jgi:hypothetical protein